MIGIWTLVIIRPPISDLFNILFYLSTAEYCSTYVIVILLLVCSCVFVNAINSVLKELSVKCLVFH